MNEIRSTFIEEKEPPELPSSARELMTFRVEQAVRDRVSDWAKKQFLIVAGLFNLIILLGFGTIGYSLIKSSVDDAVSKSVQAEISNSKANIDASVNSYRSIVNDAIRELNDERGEIERLKLDLRLATADADNATLRAKKISEDLKIYYEEFAKDMNSTRQEMINASSSMRDKYDKLRENYQRWGEDIYNRSSIAVEIMANYLAKLRALQNVSERYNGESIVSEGIAKENNLLVENGKILVIFYVQSGIDREHVSETKWALDLQLRGFLVEILYSGDKNYYKSKLMLQRDTSGFEDIVSIEDVCTIVSGSGSINGGYVDRVRNQFKEVGMPTDCLKVEEWHISEDLKSNLNQNNITSANSVVISYFLNKSGGI